MFKWALVFSMILAVALAGQAIGKLQPKPEKFKDVEGCYIDNLDAVIPFGSSAPAKGQCMEFRCGTEYITYTSCGSVAAEPPLRVVSDPSKPYPHCCPEIVGPA